MYLEFKFVNQEQLHIYVFGTGIRQILRKGGDYVYQIQIDGAQNCSCMCMCIEFLIEVLKRKNVHIFFLLGWCMSR